jgi:hypothetical protein
MVRYPVHVVTARRAPLFVLALLLSSSVVLVAHTVPIEQVVTVDARIERDALLVRLHIPIDAVAGAGLPRSIDGTLSPDATSVELDTAAADAVRNLDVRAEQALRPTRLSVEASPDRTALDVDAAFGTTTLEGVDARLNAFQVDPLKPVVTMLRVHRDDGRTLVARIAGPATRVPLDPGASDVISRFVALAAHLAVGWSDQILVLLAALSVMLSGSQAARRVTTVLLGQVGGMVLFRAAGAVPGTWLPVFALIGASMVVIAGLHAALNVRASLVVALLGSFGVVNGFALAASLSDELPFAGIHPVAAVGAFVAFTLVAESWIAAIGFAARRWLAERGVRDPVVVYGAAAFVIHTGLHRFADAGAALSATGSLAATHAVALTALGWALLALLAAAVQWLLQARGKSGIGLAPVDVRS